ncbi:MAG: aminoglycoside phosphotransferase family protein, partial [Clostridia bacterium]|nr:aminoglycoside phosphotransferase family protein [Clostridia bacterium]
MKNLFKQIKKICLAFNVDGRPVKITPITSGHVNSTYKVGCLSKTGKLTNYLVQRVNTYVFTRPEEVMQNISYVTEHLAKRLKDRPTLHYLTSEGGKNYYVTKDNGFWRCGVFYEDCCALENCSQKSAVYLAGVAFGEFQRSLKDFPIDKLNVVIPHFHNTKNRFEQLKEAIKNGMQSRVFALKKEIEQFLRLESLATTLYQMQEDKKLPLRVCHNDTKCSNVLLKPDLSDYFCVIDLDTVMPGLVAFDFGDAIRGCASSGLEDDINYDSVHLDFEKYKSFTQGFLYGIGGELLPIEKQTLALGAFTIT